MPQEPMAAIPLRLRRAVELAIARSDQSLVAGTAVHIARFTS